METSGPTARTSILRNLPSIDFLLHTETGKRILPEAGQRRLTEMARAVTDELRRAIGEGKWSGDGTPDRLSAEAERMLEKAWDAETKAGLRRVINATGVVIHTNLGRAPLSQAARRAIGENASGYCTLEYSVKTGKRGLRGARAESLLAELTGADAALIVNNCAAAAFLVLKGLASGGEVVISRGELVEIGGDFRVPEVLTQSGAILKEVGTTNRTKLSDYEKAINENTAMILRVHPSNYRIVGFTSAPTLHELTDLAHAKGVILYEDAGSGALFDLSHFGLKDEPVITESIAAGADIVTFSGDKLLGGPQAGLIVGKNKYIEKIRKHPLFRALRADKLVLAALEATLESFARGAHTNEVPVVRMLSMSAQEIGERAAGFIERLKGRVGDNRIVCEAVEGVSAVGGGSAPTVEPKTTLLAVTHSSLSTEELESRLRHSDPPIVARIIDGQLMIDLRTVAEEEEGLLLETLATV